jgi:release factor glutamine methyltransferase
MTSVGADRSVREVLREGIARLRQANVPSFTLAAELLLLHVTARNRTWLYSHPEELLPSAEIAAFFALISRRSAGEPTQHLTGKQEFWGLEFQVTPDVLIPRPETEHLVEVTLDRLAVRELRAGRSPKLTGEGLTLVDVGTGSGCIAAALAKELPSATVYATDISRPALDVARRNGVRLGLSERIQLLESNLLDAFHESPSTNRESRLFDLIISNPPYIGRREAASLPREVRDHEPELALYGGEEGYELYSALVAQAQSLLKPGGLLVLEIGQGSLPAVQPLLETPLWTNISVTNDLAGIPRVLAAERL